MLCIVSTLCAHSRASSLSKLWLCSAGCEGSIHKPGVGVGYLSHWKHSSNILSFWALCCLLWQSVIIFATLCTTRTQLLLEPPVGASVYSLIWAAITKTPKIGWLINNKNGLLTILEAGSPRSRRRQIRASDENSLPPKWPSSCHVLKWLKRQGLSLGSLL